MFPTRFRIAQYNHLIFGVRVETKRVPQQSAGSVAMGRSDNPFLLDHSSKAAAKASEKAKITSTLRPLARTYASKLPWLAVGIFNLSFCREYRGRIMVEKDGI
jgi:hypothetical protein